jgi:oligoendopeptidase F
MAPENEYVAEKQEELNKLYSDLIALRHQIAVNADFSNYRDFKHQEMGRFSYTQRNFLLL